MKYRYEDLSFESSVATGHYSTLSPSRGGSKDASVVSKKAYQSPFASEEDMNGTSDPLPRICDISIKNWLIPASVFLGVLVGVIVPGDSDLSSEYRPVSSIIGWIYFFAWTLSFYPQVMLNYVRKNTLGFNTDKLVYDIIGFGCLSVYCYAFRFVDSVRDSYRDKHDGNTPTVDLNDVAFGFHALFMTLVQICQVVWYNGLRAQRPSKHCLIGSAVTLMLIMFYLVVCLSVDSSVFVILNWLYFISFVKIGVTLIKYVPQVLLNRQRRSTVGWSITACTLDFIGAALSILQLMLDCHDKHHMAGIWGNIVKLALGVISIIFDVIFLVQHFILFGRGEAEYGPLLEGEEGEEDDDEEGGSVREGLYVTPSGQLMHAASGSSVVIADESIWNNAVTSAGVDNSSAEGGDSEPVQNHDHKYDNPQLLARKHLSTGSANSTSSNLWNQETQQACFGAGCFWGTQKFIGVDFGCKLFEECLMDSSQVGYMGGASKVENVPYVLEEIASGEFGHVEVFQCTFMGGNQMYEEMVKYFFQIHDCTTQDKQGSDVGPQYASTIYCYSEDQYRIAMKVRARLQKLISDRVLTCFSESTVTTRVLFAKDYAFMPADPKHQDYLQNNPKARCSQKLRFQRWP